MASRFLVPFGTGRSLFGRSDPFLELRREVDRAFDDVFRGMEGSGASALVATPRIDIHEVENGFEVTAEMPGVSENDIDLRIENDIFSIRGEKRNERQDSEARLIERSYGSFQRSVQLPFAPDTEQVQASFENGVLRVTLPRPAQQDKSRRIEVRGGQNAGAKQGQQTIEDCSSASSGDQGRSGAGAEDRSAIGGAAWEGDTSKEGGEETSRQREDSDASN